MKQFKSIWVLFSLALLAGFAAGCATGNVNLSKGRPGTDHVDFRADSAKAFSWQVGRQDDGRQNFKVIYSDLSPPPGGTLRLVFVPGQCQLRTSFLNRVVTEPSLIKVEVVDGKIMPMPVTLVSGGTGSLQRSEELVGTTVKG